MCGVDKLKMRNPKRIKSRKIKNPLKKMGNSKSDLDNYSNQLNPNNDAYWQSRGLDERPDDSDDDDSNSNNSNYDDSDDYWDDDAYEPFGDSGDYD